jgi:hypothetical protein
MVKRLPLLGLMALVYVISDPRPVATATLAVAASTAEAQISQVPTEESALIAPSSPSAGQAMLAVFPFALGTSWTYHAVIDIGAPDRPQHFDGPITETIIGATSYRANWLFHSQLSGYPMPDSALDAYYVVNGRRLYKLSDAVSAASATKPRTMADYASAQILAWPLEVGQMMGDPAFMNAAGRNVWLVQDIANVDVPAGHFKSCYLISMLTNPDDTHHWFCAGVGFVQYEYHHHGSRDNEFWQLTAFIFSF